MRFLFFVGLFLFIFIFGFVFSQVEILTAEVTIEDVPSTSMQEMPGNSLTQHLRILNKNIVEKGDAAYVKEDEESSKSAQESKTQFTGGSDGVNEFNWVHPSDTSRRVIIFPKVTYNDTKYDELKVMIWRGQWDLIIMENLDQARVFLGNSQVDCSEGKTWVNALFTTGTTKALNLTFRNNVSCGATVNEVPIVVLNLDSFGTDPGRNELIIRSPLIPEGECKIARINERSSPKEYFVECSSN